ncbi:MAG: hypothetical protein ACR2I1_07250 [Propionibacteriaceae bacterium]
MVYVLTVDQRNSRHRIDAVEGALVRLTGIEAIRVFERTVGDEFQGVLAQPVSVIQAMLILMDSSRGSPKSDWHLGIGVGAVETPMPASVRSARGPAFVAARTAVERAKRRGSGVEVATDPDSRPAHDAGTGCQLLLDLIQRRTDAGREAVALVRAGLTQQRAADRLGVSRQAVGQRLASARWPLEQSAVEMLAFLLERTDLLERTGQAAPA